VKTKRCPKCHEVKPLDEFYKSKTGKYGIGSYCKNCLSEKRRRVIKGDLCYLDDVFEKILQCIEGGEEILLLNRISTNQLTEITGKSRQTIYEWGRRFNLPRNADGTFNLKDFIKWFEHFTIYKIDKLQAKNKSRVTHCPNCGRKYPKKYEKQRMLIRARQRNQGYKRAASTELFKLSKAANIIKNIFKKGK